MFKSQSLGFFRTSSNCAYLHHLGILKFQTQVHFHITHYLPLDLVLNVNFGNRWDEMMFQEHLLILLCLQIYTNSDNLHSNETSRARQCPQVFICHPLLRSWVEFNYPTNLGVATPDVGDQPGDSHGRSWYVREKAGKADVEGRTLSGRKGEMKLGAQSWMGLLKPQESKVIREGLGAPPTLIRHEESHRLEPVEGPSFLPFIIKTKLLGWLEWLTHAPPSRWLSGATWRTN